MWVSEWVRVRRCYSWNIIFSSKLLTHVHRHRSPMGKKQQLMMCFRSMIINWTRILSTIPIKLIRSLWLSFVFLWLIEEVQNLFHFFFYSIFNCLRIKRHRRIHVRISGKDICTRLIMSICTKLLSFVTSDHQHSSFIQTRIDRYSIKSSFYFNLKNIVDLIEFWLDMEYRLFLQVQ